MFERLNRLIRLILDLLKFNIEPKGADMVVSTGS